MDVRNIQDLKPNPKVASVRPGDTVKVSSQVKEGDRVRSQIFQGVVIREGGSGPSASLTVRRVSYGVGVERSFLVHSPLLESVEVLRHGRVRRANLSYLRGRSARDARIREKGRVLAAEAGASAEAPTAEAAEPAPAQPAAPVAEATPPASQS